MQIKISEEYNQRENDNYNISQTFGYCKKLKCVGLFTGALFDE
jgi:hypothetical protein